MAGDVCQGRGDSKHLNVVDLMMATNSGGTFLPAGTPPHGEEAYAVVPGDSGDSELAYTCLKLRIVAYLLPWVWTSIPSETRRGKSAILVGI